MPSVSLNEEQKVITLLLALLKQEQLHLVAADIDGLTEVTAQKSSLLGQMATLSGVRHSALGAAGFAAEEAGMEAWLKVGANAASAPLWQDVLKMTRAAKELNRVNGLLINSHMVHAQAALNALYPPAQGDNFYGPSGLATGAPASRRLVVG